jgi:hypothetical protein
MRFPGNQLRHDLMSSPRYEGKPLLRPLECYILKSIGELSSAEAENMKWMEPKLSDAFGILGSWEHIISTAMSFPEDMPNLIREVWDRNQAIARKQSLTLSPQQFAEGFVDQNLI